METTIVYWGSMRIMEKLYLLRYGIPQVYVKNSLCVPRVRMWVK